MQDVCIFYDLIAFFLLRLNAAHHLSNCQQKGKSKILITCFLKLTADGTHSLARVHYQLNEDKKL